MNKLSCLLLSMLVLHSCKWSAQNINGIVNDYAAVKTISGTTISISTTTAFAAGDKILLIQMKGALIDSTDTPTFGNITSVNGAGTYEFLTVSSITGTVLTVSSSIINNYSPTDGFVQIVRVPKFCTPVVTGAVTCLPWDETAGVGGIIAFDAGTLTLNSSINANEKGFAGGNFALGSFGCNNGHYYGIQGVDGGQKGESISNYMAYRDGRKGKQANGGGGSNSGNSGGGGGGNGGGGGMGGNQYDGCTNFDDRGVGGLNLTTGLSKLFLGGGGGGGFEDNSQIATMGGHGGGIIYIKANAIVSNNQIISASGANVTIISNDEGAGGGGAGGTIFIDCPGISAPLLVKTNGGNGGSNYNTVFPGNCHGTGGGGGGGVFAYTGAAIPAGVTYISLGGAAGSINNPASQCYNTTHGATNGTAGVSYSNLFATPGIAVPSLTVTPDKMICVKETASLTVTGASTYSWNTGSTNSVIVVSPTLTTSYTVTGVNTASTSCKVVSVITLTVSYCIGINGALSDQTLRMYPNPTTSKLFFEAQRPFKISIIDGTGRSVGDYSFEKGEHDLDISNCAPGMYFIKVTDETGKSIRKLIKTN